MDIEKNNLGKIVQVIGAVVDAEFPEGSTPKIYDALRLHIPYQVMKTQKD